MSVTPLPPNFSSLDGRVFGDEAGVPLRFQMWTNDKHVYVSNSGLEGKEASQ